MNGGKNLAEVKQHIAKLRELKGYTQEQMANKLGKGFSIRTIQDLENDISKDISFLQLQKIAEVLEMTVSGLVGFDERIIFNNCKAEQQATLQGINYGTFTINDFEKLYERVNQEKDARISDLQKQLQTTETKHEKQIASLERHLEALHQLLQAGKQ